MLVAGNVIIGRKDESGSSKDTPQDADGQGNNEAASVGSSAEDLAEDGLAGKVTGSRR